MSNIFTALQLAEQLKGKNKAPELPAEKAATGTGQVTVAKPAESPVSKQQLPNFTVHGIDRDLLALYQNIDFCLSDMPQRAVQFIGSHEGEGVSTVVREFARVMGTVLGKSVLIVDAAHRNPTQHVYFNIGEDFGWREAMDRGGSLDQAIYKAGSQNVYLSPLVPHTNLPPQVYSDKATGSLLAELKKKFDLILIDSSPATTSPDSIAISRNVDGVVLVVAAEQTRWPVVETVKENILNNGGNILGVVLNKRRYYIPESIYRRL